MPGVEVFEFSGVVATLLKDGSSAVLSAAAGPVRADGYTVGVARMDSPPQHRGEVHPDGDELLYLVEGAVTVVLDDGDAQRAGVETRVAFAAGQGCLVPRGVWHRLEFDQPVVLVHVTPGPASGHRPPA
jgi:mannose-6-phosphate isomerase-like protein (cupin superfamily)